MRLSELGQLMSEMSRSHTMHPTHMHNMLAIPTMLFYSTPCDSLPCSEKDEPEYLHMNLLYVANMTMPIVEVTINVPTLSKSL